MKNIWHIKSSGGENISTFIDEEEVFIGFSFYKNLKEFSSKDELEESNSFQGEPSYHAASILFRFAHKIKKGDYIMVFDPNLREYYVGEAGEYSYKEKNSEPIHSISVSWLNLKSGISRDDLSQALQNALGSPLTVTKIRESLKTEIIDIVNNNFKIKKEDNTQNQDLDVDDNIDVEESSRDKIIKKILSISPENMEKFIAGVFRAMGYKTKMNGSFTQADGGYDIVASRDGLGLDVDTVFIEVKHRRDQMTSSHISTLRGALNGKRGAYFSSGGFSKDARNNNSLSGNIVLIDMPYLVDLIFEHYSNFDSETRNLLPLKSIYILE
ncbi:MAG: restriction endonuclease [Candidatus Pacebacteria bacterium]|nr:restriction endonuclease [Candidatus Paceibacterota bacterium]